MVTAGGWQDFPIESQAGFHDGPIVENLFVLGFISPTLRLSAAVTLEPLRLPMHFCRSRAPAVIGLSSDFYRSYSDLQVTLAPDKTSDKIAANRCSRRRRLPFHHVVEIRPACPARSRCLSPRTSHLFGEHGRKPEKLFFLNIETDTVGMATFTDVGMEITVISKVIKNICHQFRFDAAERDLTQIVSVTSEVRDR